jgi:hypothetical protein
MIEEIVDAFSFILQILLVALVVLGAYIGYIVIPESIAIGQDVFHPPGLIKLVAGGFIAWLLEVILFGPALVLLDIRKAIRSINVSSALPEKRPKSGTTPSHVVFSDKVLGVPPLPGMLDRPLWVQNPSLSFASFTRCGNWVNRGDPLVSFVLKRRIFGNDVIASIRSPISGRLIYTSEGSAFGPSGQTVADWRSFLFMIEIPKGEEVPTILASTFEEFCAALWDHRESVLQKPRDGSFPVYADEVIRQEIDALRKLVPVVVSKNEGTYQDRIDWLNLHQPHGIGSPTNLKQN